MGQDAPLNSAWITRGHYQYRRTIKGTLFRVLEGDGDSARWPKSIVPSVGPNGERDYYIPLGTGPGDNQKYTTYDTYRKRVGRAFARHVMNNDQGIVAGGRINEETCALATLPPGYKLFVDVTGRPQGSELKDRDDGYLFGYRTEFRSSIEFFPHLLWLAQGQPTDSVCGCPYCSGTPIEEIRKKYFPWLKPQKDKKPRTLLGHAMEDTRKSRASHEAQSAMLRASSAQRTRAPRRPISIDDIGRDRSTERAPAPDPMRRVVSVGDTQDARRMPPPAPPRRVVSSGAADPPLASPRKRRLELEPDSPPDSPSAKTLKTGAHAPKVAVASRQMREIEGILDERTAQDEGSPKTPQGRGRSMKRR